MRARPVPGLPHLGLPGMPHLPETTGGDEVRPFAVHLDHDGRPRCGQPHAWYVAADNAAVTCLACLAIAAGTYRLGYRYADTKPHGTLAAYRRHYRHGEKPCESCRQAHSREAEDRKQLRSAS